MNWPTLVLAAGIFLVGYGLVCAIWPFGACRSCKGTGKRRSPSGKNWRKCRGCKGTGTRTRVGRRVVAAARKVWE